MIEHVGDLDLHPELGAEPVDDLDGLQGLAPQFEEVVSGRHGGQPQDLLPDGADPVLGLAAEGQGFAARLVGGQQGLAIQLVGAGAGQLIIVAIVGGDHGGRQHPGQLRLDDPAVALRPRHEGHQPAHAADAHPLHAGLVHPRQGQQLGLHLAGLDAIAAYLEFVVAPAEVDQPAGHQAYPIAGAIDGHLLRANPQGIEAALHAPT